MRSGHGRLINQISSLHEGRMVLTLAVVSAIAWPEWAFVALTLGNLSVAKGSLT
jgi:hypothetical protein